MKSSFDVIVHDINTAEAMNVSVHQTRRNRVAAVVYDFCILRNRLHQLASLKHFKDDVKEVTNGREGGLMIDGYNDIQVDDTIEAYIMEEIKK